MFGEYLKKLRENTIKRGISLREVQELSGISNAYLSQIETGKRGVPTLKLLYKLAKVYGVDICEIVKEAEKELNR